MSGKISFQEEKRAELYLGLGSNMGDRSSYLMNALESLEMIFGPVKRKSRVYETEAWGKKDQQAFLNMVCSFSTIYSINDVLKQVMNVENDLGRIREEKWGARTIDIDILFYNDLIINEKNLIVPHPEIQNRRFVLDPLKEIAPHLIHPILKTNIEHLSKECRDTSKVEVYTS